MKTQLIMLDTPIIVANEKPQSNDIVYINNDVYIHEIRTFTTAFGDVNLDDCIKIVAIDKSYDKYNHSLPSIDWNGLEEEFGYIDVDKLAKELDKTKYRNFRREYTLKETYEGIEDGFIEGFKKAQSLNDKKFSLEDMLEAFYAREDADSREEHIFFEEFIQSLQQPKVFDIGIDKEEYDHDEDWSEISGAFEICKYRPKITNNSIKILRKL